MNFESLMCLTRAECTTRKKLPKKISRTSCMRTKRADSCGVDFFPRCDELRIFLPSAHYRMADEMSDSDYKQVEGIKRLLRALIIGQKF